MTLVVLNVIGWGTVGILNLLLPGKINKISYGIMWAVLMLYLTIELIEKMRILNG